MCAKKKLTSDDKLQIIVDCRSGEPIEEIAKKFDTSSADVLEIKKKFDEDGTILNEESIFQTKKKQRTKKKTPVVRSPYEGLVCDECECGIFVHKMNLKTSQEFLGCSEFPDCGNTKEYWVKKIGNDEIAKIDEENKKRIIIREKNIKERAIENSRIGKIRRDYMSKCKDAIHKVLLEEQRSKLAIKQAEAWEKERATIKIDGKLNIATAKENLKLRFDKRWIKIEEKLRAQYAKVDLHPNSKTFQAYAKKAGISAKEFKLKLNEFEHKSRINTNTVEDDLIKWIKQEKKRRVGIKEDTP